MCLWIVLFELRCFKGCFCVGNVVLGTNRCLKQNTVKTETVSFCKYLEYSFGLRLLGSSVKTLQS